MVEGAEQRRECYKIKIEKQAGTRVHETGYSVIEKKDF